MIPWLEPGVPFPPVWKALTEADGAAGLLAAGGDLSTDRLLDAYRHGIFPWFSEGQPILWWSTDPRMVLKVDQLKISLSLRKKLKRLARDGRWEVRFDSDFEGVMRACAAPREGSGGTWISDEMIEGYCQLHRFGYAHSSEVWLDGQLVGGAYGVSIGRMFFGESMFSLVTDASKIALVYLVSFLKQHNVPMLDCQQETGHLASLGAAPIARSDFVKEVANLVRYPQIKEWKPPRIF